MSSQRLAGHFSVDDSARRIRHYPYAEERMMRALGGWIALTPELPVKLLFGHDDPTQKAVEDWTRDSDHFAFHQQKIPFVYLGVEDFGQHHKATDDYETMSHDFYVRAVETAIRVIQEFDANLDSISKGRN